MKNVTKIVAAVVSMLTVLLQLPSVQHGVGTFLAAHPNVAAIVGGLISIGLLIHQPSNGGTNGTTQP